MLKKVIFLIIPFFIFGCVDITPTTAPSFDNSARQLTPISSSPMIGIVKPIIPVADNWLVYADDELGLSVLYPPNWKAVKLKDSSGFGVYPPGSGPNTPSPSIVFYWLAQAYSPEKTVMDTGTSPTQISISGINGVEYQDGELSIPGQSSYIEIPYRDGLIFIQSTLGPNVDLTPQLNEILKTFAFINNAAGSENQNNPASNNIVEANVTSTIGWQNTQIYVQEGSLLKIETTDGQWTSWKGTTPYNRGTGNQSYICSEHMSANQCVEPLPNAPQGALIGKIGNFIFEIDEGTTITAQESGNLFLRINDGDDGLYDNDGILIVRISVSD